MPDGTPFMVMEYLEGEDLGQRVEREGALPASFAIDCILQACEGLAEAHEKGIVHRDVKPSNLFLAKKPGGKSTLKVLDFGIAKAASHGGTELTRTSAIVGSPLYMSPEQLRESKDVDARTDVWSLGVTLFYLLTKRFPFEAEAVGEVYGMILYTEPKAMRSFVPALPAELEAVVGECLQKDPAKRIPSVVALADRLAAWGTPCRAPCPPSDRARRTVQRAPPWPERTRR
jgi:serine/threonine protein kinase